MKKLILVIIVLVVLTGVSFADITGITGTISHGEEITVSGSSFGSHVDNNEGAFTWEGGSPICAKFKDFEDNSITSGGWTILADVYDDWTISSTSGRTNSSYHSHRVCNNEAIRYSALAYYMSKYNAAEEVYISFYYKLGAGVGGKFFRIYGDAGNIYVGHLSTARDLSGVSTVGGSTQWDSPNGVGTVWNRVEIYLETTGNTFTVWLNGIQQWSKTDWLSGDFGGNTHTLDIGHMLEESVGEYYEFDDIYVDYTRARVEIGNEKTWANCTVKEVQVPTVWSTTSITLTVNTATFSTGTAYLFVVNDDGTVSDQDPTGEAGDQGYLITIGSESSTPNQGCSFSGASFY